MRRRLLLLLPVVAAVAVLGRPLVAAAHPLGNFTINHYDGVQVSGAELRVDYVLDMAEIPTFEERPRIDANRTAYLDATAAALLQQLWASVDGSAVSLHAGARTLDLLPGQAGLQTMRLEFIATAALQPGAGRRIEFHDGTFPGRLGWQEVVVTASAGSRLVQSDAAATSVSDALRHYPQDALTSPLHMAAASAVADVAAAAPAPAILTGKAGVLGPAQDAFATLIDHADLTPAFLVVAVLAAIALGAAHALGPGHGKALMAGYLVGTRGGPRQAAGLGLVITLTHTVGVFALGLITLFASALISPDRVYPWLTLASAIMVVALGAWLVVSRGRGALRGVAPHGHDHGHDDHHHDHDHAGHHHHHHDRMPTRGVVAMGVSAGLVPCPSALIVMLSAISLHRVGTGFLLVVAFSVGLAVALTGIGMAVAGGAAMLGRVPRLVGAPMARRAVRLVPVAGALAITLAGVVLTVQAIPAAA